MEAYFDDFMQIAKALEERQVDYVLIGGFAVILHGYPRFTQDMDIFIKLLPENVVHLKEALNSIYPDPSIAEISLMELETYPVIRYITPNGFVLDIMTKIGEMFQYHDLDYDIIRFKDINIKVATAETLYKLKKDTLRDKDKIDADFLQQLIEQKKKEQ